MLIWACAALFLAACGADAERRRRAAEMTGGDPARARHLVSYYGCHGCHTIPGIGGARGRVGPSLEGFAERRYIAGRYPNTAQNLTRWIRFPQEMANSVMPDMNVSEQDARDIAAYLYTLGGGGR